MRNVQRIALVQMNCGESPKANLDKAVTKVREAAKKGAKIICLQELFASQYFCQKEDHKYFELAETIPGPSSKALCEVAAEEGVVVIGSLFEKRAPGLYHNTAVVIDADGKMLGLYRKMHIPDDPLYYEKFYFTPADQCGETGGFRVFKTKFATLGLLICWDQWFPEAARITSLMGADILIYPTAIGWHPKEKAEYGESQREAWRTIQRSHAIANGVYVAAVNRVGFEPTVGTDGIEFFGNSFISDPFGRVIADSGTESKILIADCSKKKREEIRRYWPFLRDRRIDAYTPILSRFL